MGVDEPDQTESFASLPAERVAYLRHVLTVHGNDPHTGQCRICHRPSCPDWRNAYDRLAAAGHLMAEPGRWLPADNEDGAR